jgi:type II secretory pathway component PulF
MPTYYYQGINENGKTKKGYLGAPNIRIARKNIAFSGVDLLSLKTVRIPASKKKHSENFFLYMSYAIHDKSTLHDALHTIQASFSKEWVMIIQSIIDQVSQGKSFSDACAGFEFFPDFVPSILRQGEKTATLHMACHTCYKLIQEMRQQQDSLIKVLIHPILNLLFFLCATALLVAYFVPSISDMFIHANVPEPKTIQYLVFLKKNWIQSVIALFFIALLSMQKIRKMRFFRTLHCRKVYLSFFSSLYHLSHSRVPLVEALKSIQDRTYNKNLRNISQTILQEIKKGKTLSQAVTALPDFSKFYVQIIASGESSNRQKDSLDTLVKVMRYDHKKSLDRMSIWTGPLIITLLSLGLWLIVQSTFIPLYQHMGNIFHE